jgi:hypothetical protein
MQRFADGNVSIIGHGGKEKKFCYTKKINKKNLSETTVIGDSLITS